MDTPQRYDAQTILLCIDGYHNDIPVGRFSCPCQGQSGRFRSMTQMLMQIDQRMDIQDSPQAFCSVRSFSPAVAPPTDTAEEISCRPGSIATFTVQLLYRRNASWQGTVTWQEKQKTMPFRSALELIYLINSAASRSQPDMPGKSPCENFRVES